MTTTLPPSDLPPDDLENEDEAVIACVLVFNASDPSGASGISADVLAIASVGRSDGGNVVVMSYSEARYNRFILFDTGDTRD